MLQIPSCPRESNKATAASKSLRHICPSRLQAAGPQELRDRVWGQLEESRGRQHPHVGVYTLADALHSTPEPLLGNAPGICSLQRAHKDLCVWLLQDGKHYVSVSVYTGQCFRLLQALSAMLRLVWTTGYAQNVLPQTIPFGRAAPNHLQGSAVPLNRTGYATSCSPGKPSLAGSSGSAQPDLPACTPGVGKQRAGHEHQPEAPASWCCALGEQWGAGKALTI